ncbi:MAG: hypothetical protein WC475_02650 [Candidatus Paceibacterota bacterium]
MDDAYYWIHDLVDLLIAELGEEIGKDFVRDEEMTLEAAKHSEAMMHAGFRYPTIPSLLESGKVELTDIELAPYDRWPPYQEQSVREAVKKLARKCVLSQEVHPALRSYPFIGVGIAVKEKSPGQAVIFSTVRLRR